MARAAQAVDYAEDVLAALSMTESRLASDVIEQAGYAIVVREGRYLDLEQSLYHAIWQLVRGKQIGLTVSGRLYRVEESGQRG